MTIRLITLGEPGLERDGRPVEMPIGKPFALLVRLALAPAGIARAELARMFWPDVERSYARQSLRQALSRIRSLLDLDPFVGDDPIALAPDGVGSDVRELRRALQDGRLDDALALWRGPFLSPVPVARLPELEQWCERVRASLDREMGTVLAEAAEKAAAGGEPGRGIELAERAVAIAPHLGRAHRALVESLLAAGRVEPASEALRHAEEAAGDLGEDAFEELERRLERLREARERESAEHRRRFVFAGRDRELAELGRLWRSTAAGRCNVALLRGPTGMGKTRLAQEFALTVRGAGGAVITAKALVTDRSIEWGLLAELVSELLGISGSRGTSPASDQVLRSLLPSRRADGRGDGALPASVALADALADLLGAISFENPLLVICDDLQWADPASTALLGRVARRLGDEAVLFLFVYRSERIGTDGAAIEQQAMREIGATMVRLGRLSNADMAEILHRSGLAATPEDASALADRFDPVIRGNPLFLRFLLEELEQRDILRADAGGASLDPRRLPSPVPAPEAVRSVLAKAAAARRAIESAPRRRRWTRLAAAIAVALLAMAAIAVHAAVTPSPWVPPPYGGGTLLVRYRNVWHVIDPPDDASGAWKLRTLPDTLPTGKTYGPFRTTDGEVLWFYSVDHRDRGPDVARLDPGGDTVLLTNSPGDDYFGEPSPDGRWIAYSEEDTSSLSKYTRDAVVTRADGSEPRRVYANGGQLFGPYWSRDGQLLVIWISADPDTLHVLTPDGRRVATWVEPELGEVAWCGHRIAATVDHSGQPRLALFELGVSEPRLLPGLAFDPLACSPDGTAAVHATARDGQWILVLHDLETNAMTRLPDPGAPLGRVVWLPDQLPPVPVRLDVGPDTISLLWGSRRRLGAAVVYSDSLRAPADSIQWSIDDPDIASVVGGDRLTGNHPGTTTLSGRWGYSLRVTRTVRVTGERPLAARVAEDFATLDTLRWIPVGWPHPLIDTVDGAPALFLQGDRKYVDGVVLRSPVSAITGLTVELQAKVPLTQPDYQDLALCLVPDDPAEVDRTIGDWGGRTPKVCARYPGTVPGRTRPTVSFSAPPSPELKANLDPAPGDRWFDLAIQIQPDGRASLYVDRKPLLVAPVHLRLDRDSLWTVRISGRSVGTTVHVRNLTVWTEPRFEP